MSVIYQFGDSALAAERLQLLAAVFEPSSRAFLEHIPPPPPATILDLGCGPGCTTRLLADVFPAALVCGADSSPQFIEVARQTPVDRVTFAMADATQPLPGGPYDLIYCRYLLTHIPEAEASLTLWSKSLGPGGRIAIEENEWIDSSEPAFVRYLDIAAALLRDAGQELYIGTQLAGAKRDALDTQMSEVVGIAAENRDAARMFRMNLDGWRTRPYIAQNYSDAQIEALRQELIAIAECPPATSSITFGRRRIVLRRAETRA